MWKMASFTGGAKTQYFIKIKSLQGCWLKLWQNRVQLSSVLTILTSRAELSAIFGSTAPRRVFFFGVRIMLGMNFNYLILWVRVKGQGWGFG